MKAKIFYCFIIVILLAIFVNAVTYNQIFSQTGDDEDSRLAGNDDYYGQTLQLNSSDTVYQVTFKQWASGSCSAGDAELTIWNDTDDSGDPDVIINTFAFRNCSDLGGTPGAEFTYTNASGQKLNAGWTYYFGLRCVAGDCDGTDAYQFRRNSANPYPGGNYYYTTNGGGSWNTQAKDLYIKVFGAVVDNTPPTNSTWNITSGNNFGEDVTVWATSGATSVNISSDLLSFTVSTNENSNGSCRLDVEQNYNEMVSTNASYKFSTTETTAHSYTVFDDISVGNHCLYCSFIDSLGNEPANATSSSGCLNLTRYDKPTITLNNPADAASVTTTRETYNVELNFTPGSLTLGSYANCSSFTNSSGWARNKTLTTIAGGTQYNITTNFTVGYTYLWGTECCTTKGSCNSSANRTFTLSYDTSGISMDSILLDGKAQSRKYEYGTLSNITTNTTCSLPASQCTVCIQVDGVNKSCGTNDFSYLYNHTPLKITTFNDSSTAKNLTGNTTAYVALDNRTDIASATFNVTGNNSVTNVSIDWDGDGNRDVDLIGDLIRSVLYMNKFSKDNAGYTILNLTRSTSGIRTIYSNISTSGTTATNNALVRFSMILKGFNIDVGNEVSFTEEFRNTTFAYNTSSFNNDFPFWLYDDFSTTSRTSIYTSTSGTGRMAVNTTSKRLEGYSRSTNTCNSGSASDSDNAEFATLLHNISQYKRIEFYGYCDSAASCNSAGTSGATADTGCSFVVTNSPTLASSETIPGTSANLAVGCGASGNSNTKTTSGTYILERVEDFPSATYTFNVYKDGVFQGTTDALNGNINLGNRGDTETTCTYGNNPSSAAATINMRFDTLRYSGVANNYTADMVYYTNSTFISDTIATTTNNISIATLTGRSRDFANCTVSYFLSNNNGTTWTSSTSGVATSFSSQGKNLKWKGDINCTVNYNTSAIVQVDLEVIPKAVTNLTVDVGADGTQEWGYNGTLNATTSPQTFSTTGTAIRDYINENCGSNLTCNVPTAFSFGTPGTVEVSSFNITLNPNPIDINETEIEQDNPIGLTLNFNAGSVELDDVDFRYRGSANITAFGYFTKHPEKNNSQVIQVRYSKLNLSLARNVSYWEVFPKSTTQANVTPYGQTDNKSIWNITGQAYDDNFDLYVKVNVSTNSCLNITFSNNTVKNDGSDVIVSTTAQEIYNNNAPTGIFGIWNWVDLIGCSNRFEIPYFTFLAICDTCVRTTNWTSNVYNLEG